jgi:hypothetical protein
MPSASGEGLKTESSEGGLSRSEGEAFSVVKDLFNAKEGGGAS